jgi:hypothetical protein
MRFAVVLLSAALLSGCGWRLVRIDNGYVYPAVSDEPICRVGYEVSGGEGQEIMQALAMWAIASPQQC